MQVTKWKHLTLLAFVLNYQQQHTCWSISIHTYTTVAIYKNANRIFSCISMSRIENPTFYDTDQLMHSMIMC